MQNRTIYFDEAGFTGYNLLDPAQPIFVIASADIAEDRAEAILSASFPRYAGTEFKFSNIWRSNHRAGLLTFAQHLHGMADHCFIYVVDKRFAVLTKIVDFLIEPYVTDAGYDFYGDGFCWKYANYIYFGLTRFAPPELLDGLLRQYQAFSRDPSCESLSILRNYLNSKAANSSESVQIFFEQMTLGAELFQHYYNVDTFRSSNELQTTTMIAVISYWRGKHNEDFAVIHDTSSNFLRGQEMWRRVTSADVPRQLVRGGDLGTVEYPLRVVSTTPMDSRDSRSIQFCDVLAGFASRHFSPRSGGDERVFTNEVIRKGFEHIAYGGILPSVEFPDQIPPKRLKGPDVIDQMTGIMFGRHHPQR